MPTEITVTAYSFSELKGRAKERAREWCLEGLNDWEWWDSTYDHWIEKLAALGVNTDAKHMQFSGFSSQGDGASFTGTIDMPKFMLMHDLVKDRVLEYAEALEGELSARLVQTPGIYVHEHMVSLDYDYDGESNKVPALMEEVLLICRGYMKDLYKDLEEDYNYQCSDESVAECCAANGYKFDEEGSFLK